MKSSPILRRMIFALGVLSGVFVLGVTGFMLIEGYSLLDAAYTTSITLSSVGYGLKQELSPAGKVFVMGLVLMSISAFLYSVSTLTSFLVEGELKKIFLSYRIRKEVSEMKDHVIICGLGRNGREAALELIAQGVPFVAIEKDPANIESLQAQHKLLAYEGDATDESLLVKANIANAKGIITALPEDSMNVYVALSARELNPRIRIVARASHESTISKLRTAGAHKVILPNLIGGRKMANLFTQPALEEFIDLISGQGESRFSLMEVDCSARPLLIGRKLGELEIKSHTGALVLGYRDVHGKMHLNPPQERIFQKEDILFVLGSPDQLQKFRNMFG